MQVLKIPLVSIHSWRKAHLGSGGNYRFSWDLCQVLNFDCWRSSPELDEQLFFHASELVQPEGEEQKPFLDFIAPGDEVEFVIGQNTG